MSIHVHVDGVSSFGRNKLASWGSGSSKRVLASARDSATAVVLLLPLGSISFLVGLYGVIGGEKKYRPKKSKTVAELLITALGFGLSAYIASSFVVRYMSLSVVAVV